jgi:hypothetical protein
LALLKKRPVGALRRSRTAGRPPPRSRTAGWPFPRDREPADWRPPAIETSRSCRSSPRSGGCARYTTTSSRSSRPARGSRGFAPRGAVLRFRRQDGRAIPGLRARPNGDRRELAQTNNRLGLALTDETCVPDAGDRLDRAWSSDCSARRPAPPGRRMAPHAYRASQATGPARSRRPARAAARCREAARANPCGRAPRERRSRRSRTGRASRPGGR